MAPECEYGKANRVLIETFNKSVTGLKVDMVKKFDDVWVKIDDFTKEMAGRPTWLVLGIMSFMSGVIGVLSTFIITNSHKLIGG